MPFPYTLFSQFHSGWDFCDPHQETGLFLLDHNLPRECPTRALTAKLGAPLGVSWELQPPGCEGITEAVKVLAVGMTYILQAYPEEKLGTDIA